MRTHFLVLTYERTAGLTRLLASIRRQDNAPHETAITVLDNASSSISSRESAKACQVFGATYVLSPQNTMMRGKRVLEDLVFAEAKRPDAIVHLDDDVTLTDGWLEAALAPLRGGKFAACGSVERWQSEMVYSGQCELRLSDDTIAGRKVRLWDWEWQPVDQNAAVTQVEFAGHRALAVTSEVAQDTRHDTDYLIGGEDLDYSLELQRNSGLPIAIAAKALIHHRAGGEQDAPGFRTNHNVMSSWCHFYSKWGFVRRNACHEAGLSLEDFVTQVAGTGEEVDVAHAP